MQYLYIQTLTTQREVRVLQQTLTKTRG